MIAQLCVLLYALGCISRTESVFPEPILYWSVTEVEGAMSCLYSLGGAPSSWVTELAQGGDVVADPLCVNKTLFEFGRLVADIEVTRKVFTLDRLGGGLTTFAAYKNGDVVSFLPSANNLRDLAADWISQNIYFTDPDVGVAMTSYKTGANHVTVLTESVDDPRGIVVDPNEGSVFWVDAGSGTLQSIPVQGGAPTAVAAGLISPTWLAVDRPNKRLYWFDDVTNQVMTSDYAGSDVTSVVDSVDIAPGVFSGIEVYDSYIFGLVAHQAAIVVWDKSTGAEVTILHFSDSTNVTQLGISMTVPDPPLTDNLCDLDNGECGHLCVYGGYALRHCLCDFGFQSVEKDCYPDVFPRDNFLLVSDMGAGRLYQISLTDPEQVWGMDLERTVGQRVEGVTYDDIERHVYWTDTGNRTLRRARLNTRSPVEQIVYTFPQASLVEGITFDTYDRYIYYTDLGLSVIGRINVDTLEQNNVLTLGTDSYPLAIQADTHGRYIYWSDIGFPAKIERAMMPDGSDRQTIVQTDLASPTGLSVDVAGTELFWVDEYMQKLSTTKADGSQRADYPASPGSFGITMDKNNIYTSFLHEIRRYPTLDVSTYINMGPKFFSNIFGMFLYSSTLPGKYRTTTVAPSLSPEPSVPGSGTMRPTSQPRSATTRKTAAPEETSTTGEGSGADMCTGTISLVVQATLLVVLMSL